MKGRLPIIALALISAVFALALGPATGSASAAPPTVSNVEVSSVTAYEAELSGTVNPNGTLTLWSFEIQSPGSDEWLTITNGQLEAGTEPVPLQTRVIPLDPLTEYQVRLRAQTFDPPTLVFSPTTTSFTTRAEQPIVTRVDVIQVTPYLVRLGGSVFPRGTDTDYGFLIRKAGAPGWDTVATGRVPGDLESERVAATASPLEPSTAYELILSATNASGVLVRSDEPTRFTTLPAPAVRVSSATAKVTRKSVLVRTTVVISDPGGVAPGQVQMRGFDLRGGRVLCQTTKTVFTPGRHEVSCNLGSKGRQQLRKRPLQLSMRASFIVTYAEGFKYSEVADRDLTIKRTR